ncbi:MAG TPA: tyrosine-type recombinase/integrase [Candidatus Acidoferrales bacterium]|nr:tyrosine-type recombinase/integrase [Candidatus Acidoferrales bacterium]
MTKQQSGYVFHRYGSWFVRYYDTDSTGARKQVCEKLKVAYGGEYTTKRSVQPFVAELLAPLNSGLLNPQSTMPVTEFVERIYLPEYVEKTLRPASLKQYRDVWNNHLKPRMGALTLRGFRTIHGEQMLAQIATQAKLGRSSLRHCKAFLSGAFKQAKRLGILDSVNPIQDVSIPRVAESEEDTYAYSLAEIKTMLARLPEPARTVVYTAAFSGLRKSELLGLCWQDFDGNQLTVRRSVWNGTVNEPKTRRSKAPIPVVEQLAEALEAHRERAGILAQPGLPIFQAGNSQPLNLDNLARRVIGPSIERCKKCGKMESEHLPESHMYELDRTIEWHGWHAFRRGLATNLHALGVEDKTIQAILRHSNLGLTMNVYVKSVSESQVNAMDTIGKALAKCNVYATPTAGRPN